MGEGVRHLIWYRCRIREQWREVGSIAQQKPDFWRLRETRPLRRSVHDRDRRSPSLEHPHQSVGISFLESSLSDRVKSLKLEVLNLGKSMSPFTSIALPVEQITTFCEHWQIVELALFGSVLRADFHADSDIDILVTFAAAANWGLLDHAQMQQDLEALLGRPVDLISRRAIERSSNWVRRQEILSTAQPIYVK
jgi:uncharacterized protein